MTVGDMVTEMAVEVVGEMVGGAVPEMVSTAVAEREPREEARMGPAVAVTAEMGAQCEGERGGRKGASQWCR